MTTPLINQYTVVSPAYGRDYSSEIHAKEGFLSGRDFRLNSVIYGGMYCSIRDFAPGTQAEVRFNKLQDFVVVTVPEGLGGE